MPRRRVRLPGLSLLIVTCAAAAQPASSPAPAAAAPATPPASAAPAVAGTVPPLQACAVKAFDEYAVNMSLWERDWAEGVMRAKPEFNAAVTSRAKAHNSALQRDGYRIHYLAGTAPDSLDLENSIASLRLFDWTGEQENTLRASQPAYVEISDAADRDRKQADEEPKADELENYFEESFSDSAGALWAHKLKEVLQKGNSALAQCHKSYPAPAPVPDAPGVDTPPVVKPDGGATAPAGGGSGGKR